MTLFLSIEQVVTIHDMQIAEFGGASGLRDIALLEAAVYRPQSGYYDTEIEMAAALWESLSQNHPFVDGIKRTAMLSTLIFLQENGYEWDVDDVEMQSYVAERYSTATMQYEILHSWLVQNMRKTA